MVSGGQDRSTNRTRTHDLEVMHGQWSMRFQCGLNTMIKSAPIQFQLIKEFGDREVVTTLV